MLEQSLQIKRWQKFTQELLLGLGQGLRKWISQLKFCRSAFSHTKIHTYSTIVCKLQVSFCFMPVKAPEMKRVCSQT